MKKVITTSIVMLFILTARVNAQDFHLTQYDAFSMYMNPALTGNYLGEGADYKIYGVSRTQWKPLVSKAFSTCGIGYDMKYQRFGFGGYILNNRSGAANFNTMNIQLSSSYFITDPGTSPHLLNVGLQMGVFYKSFNPNKLLFESQYDYSTGTLNPNFGSGETWARTSTVKFDPNIGVFYKYNQKDSKFKPFVGFSIYHATMAKENMTAVKSGVPMRFNLQTGCDIIIDDSWKVVPMILYMNQARASELNVGALVYYNLNGRNGSSNELKYELIFGANYRIKDALMLQAGIKKDNIVLRMSYDVNTSYLHTYSNGRGAFELTLSVTGKKGKALFGSLSKF